MNEREIFVAALKKSNADERMAYLNEACGNDAALRQQVETLLREHDKLGSFLESPAQTPAATIDEPFHNGSGTQIGPYKLLQQIGEGGMGTVYMAEQTEPVKRKVALKVIKPGMDSRQVIARFEAERQALAIMDHPNIAKVFDGGATDSGRPYFVMELVKGVPITEFCDEQKLTPRQRLELFVPVCQAVQHAHQKGIIHRDLKPSNVLVSRHDTTPIVKVIDFGVAKAVGQALTDKTLFTGIAQMIGTPLYMSPEQAGMSDLDVDTRSDIYSLGVLLYELLTGTTPFEKERFKQAAYDEIRRIIREEEPPKPSTRLSDSTDSLASISAQRHMEPAKLTKLVRGELDWIVMKALEKDRSRRYETANGFAADVQRYLAGEAVQAVPASTTYRLKKFVRRNRPQVIAASLVLASLVSGIIGTSIGMWRAEQRRVEAEQAKKKAEAAEDRTLEEFRVSTDDALKELIGSKPELGRQERAYLEKTLKRWQVFADRQGDDERSMAVRAEGHFRVGLVWGALGRQDEARNEYQTACELWKKIVAQFPAVPEYQRELGGTHNNLGIMLRSLGERDAARKEFEAARDLHEKLVAQYPDVPYYQHLLAVAHNNLGALLRLDLGERDAAGEELEAARDLHEKLVAQYPDVPAYQQELARTHDNLGNLLAAFRERVAALKEHETARDLRKKLVAQHPDVPAYQYNLAGTHNSLAILLRDRGEGDAARKEHEAARELEKKLVAQYPAVTQYQVGLGGTCCNIGALIQQLQPAESLTWFDQAIATLEPVHRTDTRHVDAKQNLRNSFWGRARSHNALKKHAEAIKDLDKAVELSPPAEQPSLRYELARTHYYLGGLLRDLGDRNAARKELEAARELQKKLDAQHPAFPANQQALAITHNDLGLVLMDLGERDAARKELETARDLRKELVAQHPAVTQYQVELGGTCCNIGALIQQLQPAESLTWFDQAIATLEPVHRTDTRHVMAKRFLQNSFMSRASSHDALKKHAEAIKDWDKAVELSPPAEQPSVRAYRATSRIQAGLVAEAVAEIEELSKLSNWSAGEWYDFACVYGVASGKIADKKKEYADRAMALLHQAVKAGFKDAAHMKKDHDLDVLRERNDFKKLIAELEAKSK